MIFPLSIPGVLAGATFAFVLSLGDFLAPLLLGGPSGIMISNIVVSLFGAAYNWPLGAAISLCMLVLVVSLLFLSERLEKKWSFSMSATNAELAARAGYCSMRSSCLHFFICRSRSLSFIRSTGQASGDFLRATSRWTGIARLFADGAIWESVVNSLIVAAAAMVIALGLWNSGGAGAGSRAVSRKSAFPPTGAFASDSARNYHRAFAADAVQRGEHQAELADDRSGAWNGVDFGRDHRSIRRTCKSWIGRRKKRRSIWGRITGRHFWRVTVPNLKLSIIGAALLIFTLSMDEIAVSFFLIGRDNTLPLEIWGRLRRGITPEINAVSTIIFVFSLVAIVLWYRLRVREAEGIAGDRGRSWSKPPFKETIVSANRRDFIKFVVAGAVAAGCPIDLSLFAAPGDRIETPKVEGEGKQRICHQVRDGKVFTRPPASREA